MSDHPVVSREEWLGARKAFLEEEKAFTRLRDKLSAKRRALPWTRIDKTYNFDGPSGAASLSDLFGPHKQLIVQHFMFAPEWEKPCKSCSFWADGYNGIVAHLEHRDTRMVAVSRAPRAKLAATAQRLGWSFPWYSSQASDFSYDFEVSFRPDDLARGPVSYNYAAREMKATDMPGISAFIKGEDGAIYHTYSCFARGLDMMNAAYHYLDLTALGRHEEDLPFSMNWVRLHDEYVT